MSRTRLVSLDDAPALGRLLRADRDFLAPYEPERDERYFTDDGQREALADVLQRHAQGLALPREILDDEGRVVGRITLTGIERGPFQNCRVGYLVAQEANGRGFATAAVGEVVDLAFTEMGLHRVEAGMLVDNIRSQRVLERNGFVRFGMAPPPRPARRRRCLTSASQAAGATQRVRPDEEP
jgi:ribosomal-protein-alanine N-acetyltransferase